LEKKMSFLRKMMASSLFVAVFTGMMFAQGGATGAIGGVVQDASGAVIANAKVSVKSEATGEVLRQVTTDASGVFTATLIARWHLHRGSGPRWDFPIPNFPASWCASRKPRA
jgi:hypothetical protein